MPIIDDLRQQLAAERAALRRGDGSSVVVEELEVQVARAERVVQLDLEAATERQQATQAEAHRAQREVAGERVVDAKTKTDAALTEAATLFHRLSELEAEHDQAATKWRRAAQVAGDTGTAPLWPPVWRWVNQSVRMSLQKRLTPDEQAAREAALQETMRERRRAERKRMDERSKQAKTPGAGEVVSTASVASLAREQLGS